MHRTAGTFGFLLSLGLFLPAVFAQVSFERHNINTSLKAAYWVYPEDVDSDGDLDLTTASFNGIDWWENDGNQNFQKHFLGTATAAWSVFAADLDGDGDIDVIGGSTADKEIVWFENRGSSFVRHVLESNFQDPESIFVTDLDGDGDNDVISCAVNDEVVAWWENKGNQNFTKHIIDNLPRAHAVFAADLNNDGTMDIIASGSSKTRWYQNDGTGSFTRKTVGPSGAWGVSAFDLDNDGDKDVLRTQRDNGDVDWFENDGNGGFSEHVIEPGYGEAWSVVAGDVDGDGDLDVAAAGFAPNKISLWLNGGGGSFSSAIVIDSVDTPRGVYITDLDGDGDGDIAAAIREDRDLVWYEALGSVTASITVNSPAPGDTLITQEAFQVGWSSTGQISNVKLEFSADDGVTWSTVTDSTPNDGDYSWLVPDKSSALCLLRISDTTDSTLKGATPGNFSIVRPIDLPQGITVLTPDGTVPLFADSAFSITWATEGLIENVSIDLSLDNGVSWQTITTGTPNDGSFGWVVPDTTSEQCLIRISDTADADPVATGPLFAIIRQADLPQSLTVLAPNGNERLLADSTFVITWLSEGVIADVVIEWSPDDGQTWQTIVSTTPNDGSHTWAVPDTVTSAARLRITDAADGTPSDTSDATFAIERVLPPGVLTVLSPNGGEQLAVDSTYAITWSSTGDVGIIRIEFSPDGGSSWSLVIAGTQNDGSFDWLVPGVETEIGLLRISDAIKNQPVDLSDTTFTIIDFAQFRPFLTAFEPPAGPPGTEVFISGGRFSDVTNLAFNQAEAVFVVESDSTIRATVPQLGSTGRISVANFAGVALSATDFQVRADGDTTSFTFLPTDDGQVKITEPGQNYGNKISFKVERDKFLSFLQFNVSGIPGTVIGAELRLYATGASDFGGAVSTTSIFRKNTTERWTEEVLTFVNSPVIDPDTLSVVQSIAIGDTAVFDLGQAVTGDGIHSFAIQSTSNDQVQYASKEAAETPVLVVRALTFGNLAPIAVNDEISLAEDSVAVFDVVSNDVDPDGTIDIATITILTGPVNGSASLAGSEITYIPTADFSGLDSLRYNFRDNEGVFSNPGKVFFTINSVNDVPVALPDSGTTLVAESLVVAVLENDSDIDGQLVPASLVLVDPGAGGAQAEFDTVLGTLSYSPAPGFLGVDTLLYTVADDSGAVSASAAITITVNEFNQPPFAADDVVETEQDKAIVIAVLANDVDPEGALDTTSVQISRLPEHGTAAIDNAIGTITFSPEQGYVGSDSLTYVIADVSGLVSNVALVAVRVSRPNSAPSIRTFIPRQLQLQSSFGDTIKFSAEAVDDDADSLVFNWHVTDAVSGVVTQVATSASYRMDTNQFQPSAYHVQVVVSDGMASDSVEWTLDVITSVELSSFAVSFSGFGGIEVAWNTSNEVNNLGFNVLRARREDGPFIKLNSELIPANESGNYSFVDRDFEVGVQYYYLLEDVDLTGDVTEFGPVRLAISAPESFEVQQNYPNPFNPETRIRFQLPASGTVALIVFDALGQEVRHLVAGHMKTGFHEIVWDARDDAGVPVGSGLYFYQVRFEGFRQVRKMLLIR